MFSEWRGFLTPLEPQSRLGTKLLEIWLVCPQNGTAVLKGLTQNRRDANLVSKRRLFLYSWAVSFFAGIFTGTQFCFCSGQFSGEVWSPLSEEPPQKNRVTLYLSEKKILLHIICILVFIANSSSLLARFKKEKKKKQEKTPPSFQNSDIRTTWHPRQGYTGWGKKKKTGAALANMSESKTDHVRT